MVSEEDLQYLDEISSNISTPICDLSAIKVDQLIHKSLRCLWCNNNFQEWYPSVHGWLAMLVCILGTLFNLANILVLTHKDMRNPVNMILTGIAVADCLIMIEYIPFIIHMWRLHDTDIPKEETVTKLFSTLTFNHFYAQMSLGWGIFMLFHINFTVMINNVSIFLTLALAIWRLIMIKFHSLAAEVCTIPRCRKLLFLASGNFIRLPLIFCSVLY